MKKFLKTKLVLPVIALVLVIAASAFTTRHQNATVTSFYANEAIDAGSVPTDLPSSNWTDVTSDVIAAGGLSSYVSVHCFTPTTPACVAEAQFINGVQQNPVEDIVDGTFSD